MNNFVAHIEQHSFVNAASVRRRMIATLLLCTVLVGCALSSSHSEFADTPYIEKMGPGLIRYRVEGASFTRIARREDVHKKIREACNGQHHIRKEGLMSSTGSITNLNDPTAYANVEYIYIEYECFP
jgi:hypothetical protein